MHARCGGANRQPSAVPLIFFHNSIEGLRGECYRRGHRSVRSAETIMGGALLSMSFIRKIRTLLGADRAERPPETPTGRWSIGIYTGSGPFSFRPPAGVANPVITADDVTDAAANFVADPFMVREAGRWHMFFEVEAAGGSANIGKIGLATSPDGASWQYERIVLEEPFHLSYPYVFPWKGDYYMVPETRAVREVRLYRAVDFPYAWEFAGILMQRRRFADSSLFHWRGRWWMFTDSGNTTLRLYFAEALSGPWREHPRSPIVRRDPRIARPGGRAVVLEDGIIRYAQDDQKSYGSQVWGFRVTALSRRVYREEASPVPVISAGGGGWRRFGMHTIDPHHLEDGRWIACVDGFGEV